MKSKVSYSRFVMIFTAIVVGLLYFGCIATVDNKPKFFILLALYISLIISALIFAPFYIKADDAKITMGSIVRRQTIPMEEVESVELCPPTMGSMRILGSCGFMGYWGIYREGGIGRYYAFYGKSSDCFLVRTKKGSSYMLGCDNPGEMVDYIRSQIKR